jgi:hypothetical protein
MTLPRSDRRAVHCVVVIWLLMALAGCYTPATTQVDVTTEDVMLNLRGVLESHGYGIAEFRWREGRDGVVAGNKTVHGGSPDLSFEGLFSGLFATDYHYRLTVRYRESGSPVEQRYEVHAERQKDPFELIQLLPHAYWRDEAEERVIASAIEARAAQLAARSQATELVPAPLSQGELAENSVSAVASPITREPFRPVSRHASASQPERSEPIYATCPMLITIPMLIVGALLISAVMWAVIRATGGLRQTPPSIDVGNATPSSHGLRASCIVLLGISWFTIMTGMASTVVGYYLGLFDPVWLYKLTLWFGVLMGIIAAICSDRAWRHHGSVYYGRWFLYTALLVALIALWGVVALPPEKGMLDGIDLDLNIL